MNQTYSDIEVILVDDGSTDSCPRICDYYQSKDPRVKVIHKKNGGLSDAREAGVTASTGQYAMFVDGDDWLEADTVEKCINEIIKHPNVGCVIFSYSKETPNGTIPVKILEKSEHFTGEEVKDKIYRKFFGPRGKELLHPEKMENISTCCIKLYKRKFLLQGKYFDTKEIGFCEDLLFNLYALDGCTDVVYLDEQLYHYRKTPNSLSRKYRPSFAKQTALFFSILESFLREKNFYEAYKDCLYNRIAISILVIGLNELQNTSVSMIKRIKNIKAYLKSERYSKAISNVKIKDFSLPWKLLMASCKIKFATAVYFALLIIRKIKNRI